MNFIKRVWNDITRRRNLEVHLITIVAFALAVLSILGEVFANVLSETAMTAIVTSITLAALAVLVQNIAVPDESSGNLDDFLNDRSNLGPFAERLKDARQLYIYAPSAANVFRGETIDAIRKGLLNKEDGELRVIIQNPTYESNVDILIDQLDDSVDFQNQVLRDEIKSTLSQFERIQAWDVAGTFEYGLLEYGPGFSLVVIDPDKISGQIIVETHGVKNVATSDRMHVLITKRDSERWFTYWENQFSHMWEKAEKPHI